MGFHAAAFLIGTAVILFFGINLTKLAEGLAKATGVGQAITGGLFLGAATSLPGLIASLTAATAGYPRMAVSNAVGGIAAQTCFLAIADVFYRKANLEYAAASLANLMQGALLIGLLTLPLLAFALPEFTILAVHPVTFLFFAAYCYGMHLSSRCRDAPMWRPENTRETQQDEPNQVEKLSGSTWGLLLRFALVGLLVGAAGWVIALSGMAAVERLGLSEGLVGGLFTAVSSSLPELVTSIAAVRQGAYTLAVGGIIGGNAFDTLFLAVSDIGYRSGSLYHAMSSQQLFLITLTILMTAVLVMGLMSREKRGIANIGFESFTILVLYAMALMVLILS